jgi:hypothetical protein
MAIAYIHDLPLVPAPIGKDAADSCSCRLPSHIALLSNIELYRPNLLSEIVFEANFLPVILSLGDQNLCAQSRKPMDMMVQGWSVSLFQASQQ